MMPAGHPPLPHLLCLVVLLLLLAARSGATPCAPYAGQVSSAQASPNATVRLGSIVQVTAVGIPGFGPASISSNTGAGDEVVVAWSGLAGSTVAYATLSFDSSGNFNISVATKSTSPGATTSASALSTALVVGSATAASIFDPGNGRFHMLSPLLACGLLSSLAPLAHASCALTLNVSVTMPAGLGLAPIPGPSSDSIYYQVVVASTRAPVTTARPTTHVPTHHPSTNPTLYGQTYKPSASPTRNPTKFPTTATPTRSPASAAPSSSPHRSPTAFPTTARPSFFPTSKPTAKPTFKGQTYVPSRSPVTFQPTKSPLRHPTASPTRSPTMSPGVVGTTITAGTNWHYYGCVVLNYPNALIYYFGSVGNAPSPCSISIGPYVVYLNCIIDPAMTFGVCNSLLGPGASYIGMFSSTTCLYSTIGFDINHPPYVGLLPYLDSSNYAYYFGDLYLQVAHQHGVCNARCAGDSQQLCGNNDGRSGINLYVQNTLSPSTFPTHQPTPPTPLPTSVAPSTGVPTTAVPSRFPTIPTLSPASSVPTSGSPTSASPTSASPSVRPTSAAPVVTTPKPTRKRSG